MPQIPSHLLAQSEWAVIDAVCNDVFPNDGRVWDHIDLRTGSADFDAILDNLTFSSGERLLLTTAASLWAGNGYEISLGRVANVLDDGFLRVLLNALATYRRSPLPTP